MKTTLNCGIQVNKSCGAVVILRPPGHLCRGDQVKTFARLPGFWPGLNNSEIHTRGDAVDGAEVAEGGESVVYRVGRVADSGAEGKVAQTAHVGNRARVEAGAQKQVRVASDARFKLSA